MRAKIGLLAFCLFLPLAWSAFGEDAVSRAWLLYEQGNASIAQKEFGNALQLFKDAISLKAQFPEAEMGIGDVFQEEGEFELARAQYVKAYNMRKAFDIADSKYDVLYKLAHLYQNQELYKQMEDTLMEIISDDRHFVETPNSRLQTQVGKNFDQQGIDRVLMLYSFSDAFAAQAHSLLGWFYYKSGRYSQAVVHLLYAVINRVSQMNGFLKEADVEYEFTTLHDLISSLESNRSLQAYAADTGFYKDLYYLAGATFADGYPQHALDIWRLIAAEDTAGVYKALSVRQLRKPYVEPLLGAQG
jgi:tetratricopeptide (TPR) repeat protein